MREPEASAEIFDMTGERKTRILIGADGVWLLLNVGFVQLLRYSTWNLHAGFVKRKYFCCENPFA